MYFCLFALLPLPLHLFPRVYIFCLIIFVAIRDDPSDFELGSFWKAIPLETQRERLEEVSKLQRESWQKEGKKRCKEVRSHQGDFD